jgi:uncharacterized protein (DUF58 family)
MSIRASILGRARQAWQQLTLDGRLSVAQPWVLALGPVALVLALIAPYRGLFWIAYTFLLLVLAMYLWARRLGPRVRLRRRLLVEWAQVGDNLEEQWDLRNDARLPLLWLAINDGSTLPGYSGRRVVASPARAAQQWTTAARCGQRGVYTLGPLTATLGDPFGLFRYTWREAEIRQIVIFPPLVRLPPLHVPQGQRGGLARADLMQQHVTPSVGGLREYVQGDPPSHIHWPTFARTEKMMVKEFDQERAGAFWIALDLSAAAYAAGEAAGQSHIHTDGRGMADDWVYGARVGGEFQHSTLERAPAAQSMLESPLELAIVLACSLASHALAEGRAVGLLADDGRRRLVTPGRGPRQLWRILGALVDAGATGEQPLGEVIRQGHAARASEVSGTALAVVTPALDGSWLPALASWRRGQSGGALALLIAARAELAQPLETRLAAGGIAAHTFELGAPLPLLNPPKPNTSARVSPLGRVVRSPAPS